MTPRIHFANPQRAALKTIDLFFHVEKLNEMIIRQSEFGWGRGWEEMNGWPNLVVI